MSDNPISQLVEDQIIYQLDGYYSATITAVKVVFIKGKTCRSNTSNRSCQGSSRYDQGAA